MQRIWVIPVAKHYLLMVRTDQGLVNVPIEHHPSIGDIISKIFQGDVQNPQKGTFTNPCDVVGVIPGIQQGTKKTLGSQKQ